MSLNIRTYRDLTEADRSGLADQIGAQRRRVAERLASVRREAAALREFLADVAWGALDELLVDLPPGVQRFQELTELLPARPAVLAVTIPTPESRDAVRRALRAASDGKATLLGVVENMVGGPFVGNAADELAAEFGIPVLARVPFHPGEDVWENVVSKLQ